MNRPVPVTYSFLHPGKAKQRVSEQSESVKRTRPRRGFGTTPGGRAFVWLLTLTSVAVVLAVYLSFRGANETPVESPAETGASAEAGAADSSPSTPESGTLAIQPDYFMPGEDFPDKHTPGGETADEPVPGGETANDP